MFLLFHFSSLFCILKHLPNKIILCQRLLVQNCRTVFLLVSHSSLTPSPYCLLSRHIQVSRTLNFTFYFRLSKTMPENLEKSKSFCKIIRRTIRRTTSPAIYLKLILRLYSAKFLRLFIVVKIAHNIPTAKNLRDCVP